MSTEMSVLYLSMLQINTKIKFFTVYFSHNLRNTTTHTTHHKQPGLCRVYGRKTNKSMRDNLETLIKLL